MSERSNLKRSRSVDREAPDAMTALGDQTRRSIFDALSKGAKSVGELSEQLPVSRPAVSQHLKVLQAAGLVANTAEGTKRIYRIDPRGIAAMRQWLDQHWTLALESLEIEAKGNAKRKLK